MELEYVTAKVEYTGELSCTAVHKASGKAIFTDAPVDNRGLGRSFSPTDLFATSLASCILTIMGIKAKEKGINILGATADVQKVMAQGPRRVARVVVSIKMPDMNYSDKEKRIIERAALHCPVGNSLNLDLEKIIKFEW